MAMNTPLIAGGVGVLDEVIAMAHRMSGEDLSRYLRELDDQLDEPFSAVIGTDYMAGYRMNGSGTLDPEDTAGDAVSGETVVAVELCEANRTVERSYLTAAESGWVDTFVDTIATVVPYDSPLLGSEPLFAAGMSLWADKTWVTELRSEDPGDGARYLALRSFDGQMWLAAAVITRSQQLTLSLLDYSAIVMAAALVHDYWGGKRRRASNGPKDFTRFEGRWHQGRLHYLLICLCSYLQQSGDDRHVVLSQMILGHLYGALVIPNYQIDIEMTSHGAMLDDDHADSLFRRIASLLGISGDVVTAIAASKADRWADAGKEVTLLCRPELRGCTSSQLGIWTHYGYLPGVRMSTSFCAALSSYVSCLTNCEIESRPEYESRNRNIDFEQYLATRPTVGAMMDAHYTVRAAARDIATAWRIRTNRDTTPLGVTRRYGLGDVDRLCESRWIDGWEPQVCVGQTAGLSRIDTVRGRLGQMEMLESAWTDRRRAEDGGRFIPLDNLLDDTDQVHKMRIAWSNIAKVVYYEDSPTHKNFNYIWALQYLGWAGARMT